METVMMKWFGWLRIENDNVAEKEEREREVFVVLSICMHGLDHIPNFIYYYFNKMSKN